MLVGSSSTGLGLSAQIFEPNTNREASNYIINNYNQLIGIIRKADIKEDNVVIFPNGNFVTNIVYYNNTKENYLILNADKQRMTNMIISSLVNLCSRNGHRKKASHWRNFISLGVPSNPLV